MPSPSEPSSPDNNLRRWMVRALAGVGAMRALQMVLGLATSMLLARLLGVTEFGRYTLVLSLLGLVALPAFAGVAPLAVREIARNQIAGEFGLVAGGRRRVLQFATLVSVAGMLILLMVAWTARSPGEFDLWTALLISAVTVPLLALTRVNSALLQGARSVVLGNLPEMLLRPVILLAVLVVLMLSGALALATALFAYVAAVACGCVLSVVLVRNSPVLATGEHVAQYDDPRWRSALLPFSGIAALGFLNTELFVPLVGLLASTGEVAFFKTAMSLALIIAIPLTLVESVIRPQITRLFERGDEAQLNRLVSRCGWLALALSAPVVVLLGWFAEPVVVALYGVDFKPAVMPMLILGAGFAVVNAIGPSMQLLYATNFEKDALMISFGSLLLIVLASVVLIPTEGAVGAAIVFSGAKVLRSVLFRIWARRRLATHFAQARASA